MAFPMDLNLDEESDAGTKSPASGGMSSDQLQAQLAHERELRQRSDQALESERKRVDQFLKGTQKPATKAPLGPMPDPTEDPTKYAAWLSERDARLSEEFNTRLTNQASDFDRKLETSEMRNALWATFKENRPAHAKQRELVAAAYSALQQSGSLPNDAEAIVDAVAAKMDAMVGASIADLGKTADRTPGLSGGERKVPKRTIQSDDDGDADVTMHDAISKFQADHGLI